jgi:carbon dioxide concentrating mechanism protein CcmN
MQLPPVHSISATEYFVSGNVIIHETAVIAPGGILEADSGYQIVIGAGVCIGLGTVIIAYGGNVEIEAGVALAPGTLVVGPVRIGHSACVGSRSTIFQQDIEAQALIPAGDLLMVAQSHSPRSPLIAEPVSSPPENAEIPPIPSPWDSAECPTPAPAIANPPNNPVNFDKPTDSPAQESVTQESVQAISETGSAPEPPSIPDVMPTKPEITEIADSPRLKSPVVGQVYINQLLLTLFPERKYFQS